MKIRISLALLLFVLAAGMCRAQIAGNQVNKGFELFGGGGLPLSDFADERDGGAAKYGYLFGARYTIPLGDGQGFLGSMGLFLSATATVNAIDLTLLTDVDGVTASADPWKQLWPMVGVKKTFVLSDMLSQDITVGLGAVITQSPEIEAAYAGRLRIVPFTVTLGSATGVGFAFDIGTNLVFNRHIALGFGVLSGGVEYDATVSGTVATDRTVTIKQEPLILRMNLGYIF